MKTLKDLLGWHDHDGNFQLEPDYKHSRIARAEDLREEAKKWIEKYENCECDVESICADAGFCVNFYTAQEFREFFNLFSEDYRDNLEELK